jgi:transcription antitermination protein NusB
MSGSSRKRTAARLAAVQALYQMELSDGDPAEVVAEFLAHRLDDRSEEGVGPADRDFFAAIAKGAAENREALDRGIAAVLASDWPLARLETVLRAILRLGAYELAHRPDVPTEIVINEYLDVAHAFFDGKEPGLVNGVLDALARGRPQAA